MIKTQATNLEMPTYLDCLMAKKFTLYTCPEFEIVGELYPKNRLHVHAKWDGKHMTPSLFKKALKALGIIKKSALDNDIPAIYTVVPDTLLKWETMLGFDLIEEWTNRDDPDHNLLLMKQETA